MLLLTVCLPCKLTDWSSLMLWQVRLCDDRGGKWLILEQLQRTIASCDSNKCLIWNLFTGKSQWIIRMICTLRDKIVCVCVLKDSNLYHTIRLRETLPRKYKDYLIPNPPIFLNWICLNQPTRPVPFFYSKCSSELQLSSHQIWGTQPENPLQFPPNHRALVDLQSNGALRWSCSACKVRKCNVMYITNTFV